jgi:hypothetical protein
LKVLLECSKCWSTFPAFLREIHVKGNIDPVYQFEIECMNCRVGICAYISEIDEKPELTIGEKCK